MPAKKKTQSKPRTPPSTKKPAAKAKLTAKKAPAKKKVAAKKAPAAKVAAKKPAVAKKLAAKKKPAAKKLAAKAPAKKIVRRDGAGHLDPKYAATLRAKSREGRVRDRDEAFVGREGRSKDDLAQEMGEAWVESATSGEDENEQAFNADVPEDHGGPFVTTTAGQEFAEGTDESNPKGSRREPFPRT